MSETTTPTAVTRGAHHIGLTVPDIAATGHFFREVLGFEEVGALPDYPAVFLHDGTTMLTLWQVKDAARMQPFDRHHHVGLHHLALRVADGDALHALAARLADHPGVAVEFPPEPLLGGPTQHMMCAVPGGVRVEFIA